MIATSAKFKNHPCFKDHWSGLDDLLPITLIIGKNNTGKSHLLHFVRDLCKDPIAKINLDLQAKVSLHQGPLQLIFRPNREGGGLAGSHWDRHGINFVGKTASWTRETGKQEDLHFDGDTFYRDGVTPQTAEERLLTLLQAMPSVRHTLHGRVFKHLLADRDIQPEPASNTLALSPNGAGSTNIVRRYINSSEPRFKRELIQIEMLGALNEIFAGDGNFQEITVKHHDGSDPGEAKNNWEIYLKQEYKGLVSLSASGSGLKTIFLVLLNLLVIPDVEGKRLFEYVFAFEELENNLHPTLLRNLLGYIRSKSISHPDSTDGAAPHFFLTTHSNVALDYFAGSEDSQVIHVSHDGKSARTHTIDQSLKLLTVLRDLGTRPSDILQANGIIWVEGPSDRIYVNKWIELFSNGSLREGRHYQCAIYGGGLLANLQATSDEEADEELINLLKINPNAIVISDSDRKAQNDGLKPRVQRIHEEFDKLDSEHSYHWILGAREIENYLTGNLIGRATGGENNELPDLGQYESVFPKKNEISYIERVLDRKGFDKPELAALATHHMTLQDIQGRFDLDGGLKRILRTIEAWNR